MAEILNDHLLPSQAGESHPLLVSEGRGSPSNVTAGELAMRMLYDEQTRLRTEIDDLRKKADEKRGNGEDKKGEEQAGGDKNSEEGGDEKKDKKKGDDKEEQKPALKERIVATEEKT